MIPTLSVYGAPIYDLKVAGVTAGAVLRERLVSHAVTHQGGLQSDQLSMTFDDRSSITGGYIEIPERGKELEVWLGYELHLVSMGTFQVDQVSVDGSGGGQTLSISAVPRLLLNESTKTWADTTIDEIVTAIAADHELDAKVSQSLGSVAIEIENQVRESDLSFLTRLAQKHDGVVKPAAGCLLFLQKGEAVTAGGISLGAVTLGPHDIVQWSCSLSDRTGYEGVVAIWHDLEQALQRQVAVGDATSDSVYRMPHLYASEAEAEDAAQAKLNELTRDTSSLSLTTIGNPDLTAEGKIKLDGVRAGVDGEWIVRTVTHSLNSGGYQCSLSAYKEA